MGSHHLSKNMLVADDTRRKEELIRSYASTSGFNELGDRLIRFQLHPNHVEARRTNVPTKLLLHCFHQCVSVLVCVGLIDHLQILWWRCAQELEDPFLVCSPTTLSLVVDLGCVFHGLVCGVKLRIIFLFGRLQAVENQTFHVTMQLTRHELPKVLRVDFEILLLQQFQLSICATTNNAINNIDLCTNTFRSRLDHGALSFDRRETQESKCLAKVAAKFLFHEFVQGFLFGIGMKFQITALHLVSLCGIHAAHDLNHLFRVCAPSSTCVNDLIHSVINFRPKSIGGEIIVEDESRE
mmetsp:Transcript_1363/g.1897  ORF Transcript_1363/g.1897 Transcript_1363/m.1897 type:complete len:296 (-) Transcript_1363:88-975(-)